MSNNLPSKYKEGFILKIKALFLKIFKNNSKTEVVNNGEILENKTIPNTSQINVFDKMKKEGRRVHLQEEIIELVEKNPGLLENLSMVQLEKIDELCDKIIEENNKKINGLKRALV